MKTSEQSMIQALEHIYSHARKCRDKRTTRGQRVLIMGYVTAIAESALKRAYKNHSFADVIELNSDENR